MKENKLDLSQYQKYQATGEVNRDTAKDPINNATYSRYSLPILRPMYQSDRLFSSRVRGTETNSDRFTFHMRKLLENFYEDILDNSQDTEFEKPETTFKILRRAEIRGTKDSNEYRNKKLKKADRTLRSYKEKYDDPAKYFEENPPLVCEVTGENLDTTYALLRGHHELRKAGKFNIDEIACEVISVDNLASALNAYEPSKYIGRVTPSKIETFFNTQMQVTQNSFKAARANDRPISKPQY